MTSVSVHAFPGFEDDARVLASALDAPCWPLEIHTFPDGESRIRVVPGTGTAIVFASLDHPDSKLVPLFLAAAALRDNGATRVILICPYLCYMRQDTAFRPGEAVS
ncbi:ribose-phosphate pyrophosphokinase-like domain-containing protein, partial [Kordiimonas sp.]|uniref:ribose-phosphate pyrophosphokinase-like domain-containing protein n=1 Tax=Kordiimonas sp. TaxID=1970157 RepID=UPI003A8CEF6E